MLRLLVSSMSLSICLIGCAKPLLKSERSILETRLDFSKYTAQGFFISPEAYRGDYESCGLLEIVVCPAATERESVSGTKQRPRVAPWGGRGEKRPVRHLDVEPLSIEEGLDVIHARALALGADALVHFEIHDVPLYLGRYEYGGIKLSGFAIKRKGSFK